MSTLRIYKVKYEGKPVAVSVKGNFFKVESLRGDSFSNTNSQFFMTRVKFSFDDKGGAFRYPGEGGRADYNSVTIEVVDADGNPVAAYYNLVLTLGMGDLYTERLEKIPPYVSKTVTISVPAGGTLNELGAAPPFPAAEQWTPDPSVIKKRICVAAGAANGLLYGSENILEISDGYGAPIQPGIVEVLEFSSMLYFKNKGAGPVSVSITKYFRPEAY